MFSSCTPIKTRFSGAFRVYKLWKLSSRSIQCSTQPYTLSGKFYHFIPSKTKRKPEIIRSFQSVPNGNIDQNWIKTKQYIFQNRFPRSLNLFRFSITLNHFSNSMEWTPPKVVQFANILSVLIKLARHLKQLMCYSRL